MGLMFFDIRHEPPAGGSGSFLKNFNGPTAGDDVRPGRIRHGARAHIFCELCQVNPCADVN
jgi:hypothetical protein